MPAVLQWFWIVPYATKVPIPVQTADKLFPWGAASTMRKSDQAGESSTCHSPPSCFQLRRLGVRGAKWLAYGTHGVVCDRKWELKSPVLIFTILYAPGKRKPGKRRIKMSVNEFLGPPCPYMWLVPNRYWLVWLPDSTGGKRLKIIRCVNHQDFVNEKNLEWPMLLASS